MLTGVNEYSLAKAYRSFLIRAWSKRVLQWRGFGFLYVYVYVYVYVNRKSSETC